MDEIKWINNIRSLKFENTSQYMFKNFKTEQNKEIFLIKLVFTTNYLYVFKLVFNLKVIQLF